MPAIQWSSAMHVGVEEIDSQHAVLVDLVNELHDARAKGTDKDKMADIATRLSEYTEYHFSAEEKLMRAAGYPKIDYHVQMHRAFEDKTIDFLLGAVRDDKGLSDYVMEYLADWLKRHILGADKLVGEFLRQGDQG